ncbi:MAG: hypothetical protein ACREPM_05920 [Gemmatimonadaceae bacterium]
MSHARYRPPAQSKGDASTIGGYMAVHDRPAAFEGGDGFSYSVEILCEETGDAPGEWGAFFLFIKWARIGAQTPEGHVESDYLVRAGSNAAARADLGRMPLAEVKTLLDRLIVERRGESPRRWWDAMRDEGAQ